MQIRCNRTCRFLLSLSFLAGVRGLVPLRPEVLPGEGGQLPVRHQDLQEVPGLPLPRPAEAALSLGRVTTPKSWPVCCDVFPLTMSACRISYTSMQVQRDACMCVYTGNCGPRNLMLNSFQSGFMFMGNEFYSINIFLKNTLLYGYKSQIFFLLNISKLYLAFALRYLWRPFYLIYIKY